MTFKKNKILVLGATGFLGKVVTKTLIQNGYAVSILTRDHKKAQLVFGRELKIYVGDFMSCDYQLPTHYDAIINCIAELKNTKLMRKVHVESVKRALLSIERNSDTHWIQVSSVGVYGREVEGIITEETNFDPDSMYEITKAESEIITKKICAEKGIPYTILRPSNVIGFDMSNLYFYRLIRIIAKGHFFYIGKPEKYLMNYIDVRNVADIISTIVKNKCAYNQSFNISDSISLQQFVKIIKKQFNASNKTIILNKRLIVGITKLLSKIESFPLNDSRIQALTNEAKYSTTKLECSITCENKIAIENTIIEISKYISDIDTRKGSV